MSTRAIKTLNHSSEQEQSYRDRFLDLFKDCPIPDNELLLNLGLFMNRQTLSRTLFMHELYQNIINVHGIIVEFGTRWGTNLSLFESFRGMYEPYNYTRKIVGFDTFEGFSAIDNKDGNSNIVSLGGYSVTEKYEEYLEKVLEYHEQESPLPHIKKYEVIKGDASVEIEKYLYDNPETIIALAYFDFDLYQPTKKCLEAIKNHVTKGTILGFDELSYHEFPEETLALKEVFGLDKYKIRRSPLNPTPSYIILE